MCYGKIQAVGVHKQLGSSDPVALTEVGCPAVPNAPLPVKRTSRYLSQGFRPP